MPRQCDLESNPLQEHWHGNVWVAPKGAVRNTRVWLNKTINEYRNNYINSFVFFTSASEIVRATPVIWDYPVCIPFRRIKQLRATTKGFEPVCPSTWNVLIYGPPLDATVVTLIRSLCFTIPSEILVALFIMSTRATTGLKI